MIVFHCILDLMANANGLALRPETMGAVCAIVYLLALIFFIPFAFYKDIVAATSGGGNRDVVIEVEHVETGRMLHRFPHGKVSIILSALICASLLTAEVHSLRPISPVFFHCNVLSFSELATTYLIYDGDTKS